MRIALQQLTSSSRILVSLCAAVLVTGVFAIADAAVTAKISASKAQVEGFFGTSNVKMVFVQAENNVNSVFYVDFSESSPTIRKLVANTSNISLPVISPDGNYVVYRDGNGDAQENEVCPNPMNSKIMFTRLLENSTPTIIAQTGFSPRFDYQIKEPCKYGIVYPNSMCNGTIGGAYPHNPGGPQTLRTIVDVTCCAAIVGATNVMWATGGYNAGLSADGNYLGAQYPGENVFMLEKSTASIVALNTFTAKTTLGKDTIIRTNVCNGSISPSLKNPDQMLFYTGGVGSSKVATEFGIWGAHKRLIVKNFSNKIVQVIDVPKDISICTESGSTPTPGGCNGNGEIYENIEWWNPEWSNHPSYAVASIQPARLYRVNSNWEQKQRGEYIYGVDLAKASTLRLLQTTDTSLTSTTNMIYPWLWVGSNLPSAQKNITKGSLKSSGSVIIDKGHVFAPSRVEHVSVFSATGAKVWESSNSSAQAINVSLPKLGMGMYVVKVKMNGVSVPTLVKWNGTGVF